MTDAYLLGLLHRTMGKLEGLGHAPYLLASLDDLPGVISMGWRRGLLTIQLTSAKDSPVGTDVKERVQLIIRYIVPSKPGVYRTQPGLIEEIKSKDIQLVFRSLDATDKMFLDIWELVENALKAPSLSRIEPDAE